MAEVILISVAVKEPFKSTGRPSFKNLADINMGSSYFPNDSARWYGCENLHFHHHKVE